MAGSDGVNLATVAALMMASSQYGGREPTHCVAGDDFYLSASGTLPE